MSVRWSIVHQMLFAAQKVGFMQQEYIGFCQPQFKMPIWFCLLNSVVCIEFVYQTPRTGVSLESDESVFGFLSNYLLTGMGKLTMMCIICM